jgi:multicomponent Na+:H+ antiporter subunit G
VTVIGFALISVGLFFLGVSAFGLIRFPDFYTRAHVVAKSETLGVILIVLGVIVHHGAGSGSLRLVFLVGFALVANATAIHALARAAHAQGHSADSEPERPT